MSHGTESGGLKIAKYAAGGKLQLSLCDPFWL